MRREPRRVETLQPGNRSIGFKITRTPGGATTRHVRDFRRRTGLRAGTRSADWAARSRLLREASEKSDRSRPVGSVSASYARYLPKVCPIPSVSQLVSLPVRRFVGLFVAERPPASQPAHPENPMSLHARPKTACRSAPPMLGLLLDPAAARWGSAGSIVAASASHPEPQSAML